MPPKDHCYLLSTHNITLYKQETGRETEIARVLDKLSRNSIVGLPYLHMANQNMRENPQEVNHGRESLYYRARPYNSIRLEHRGKVYAHPSPTFP